MSARAVRAVAWGSVALAIAFGVFAIGLTAGNGGALPVTTTIESGAIGTSVLMAIVLSFSIVGAIIATRRPDNWLGWLFCADGLLISFQNFAGVYASFHGTAARPGSLPGAAWFALLDDSLWIPFLFMTTAFLFLLFPEGRPVGRGRKNAVIIASVAAVVATTVAGLFEPTLYIYPDVPNPIGVQLPSIVSGPLTGASFLVLLSVLVYAVVNLFRRLRRSSGEERLQFRWFTYSTVLILLLFIPSAFLPSVPVFVQLLGALALFTLPVAVGVSIMRYRLYDIDVVIKKTVVYAILAGLIVIVGAVVILVLGGIAVGPVSNNRALLITAGAVMGFAIWPLRLIASRLADRIVFRGRETPYEVLTSFADRVAETYSTDDVLPRMAQVLAAGTGATSAAVWLRVGEGFRIAAVWPAGSEEPDAIPIEATEVRHQGEVLGALSVSMPANDPMTPTKEALIKDLAAQAGLVLRNVRLIEELRGSRRRIVAAQDERARKLERNIHDGAQQQLVAIQVKLRLADGMIERDPAKAHALIAELQRESNEALEDLRDLARGIYPPLLADRGLAAALDAQARKASVPVTVDADGVGRFEPEVEAAVYFSCLEALQNVAKYADANAATIRLSNGSGELRFEIRDDGRGFDPSAMSYGTGLQGIADRLAALGGELAVTSAPGDGTAVVARLPVEAAP
ncbi:MAG TPA: histidine kinase [Actinomycetota bacterium]